MPDVLKFGPSDSSFWSRTWLRNLTREVNGVETTYEDECPPDQATAAVIRAVGPQGWVRMRFRLPDERGALADAMTKLDIIGMRRASGRPHEGLEDWLASRGWE